jgi:hypothetical protein
MSTPSNLVSNPAAESVNLISSIAGDGTPGSDVNNGTADNTGVGKPRFVCYGQDYKEYYIADSYSSRIYLVDASNNISVVIGTSDSSNESNGADWDKKYNGLDSSKLNTVPIHTLTCMEYIQNFGLFIAMNFERSNESLIAVIMNSHIYTLAGSGTTAITEVLIRRNGKDSKFRNRFPTGENSKIAEKVNSISGFFTKFPVPSNYPANLKPDTFNQLVLIYSTNKGIAVINQNTIQSEFKIDLKTLKTLKLSSQVFCYYVILLLPYTTKPPQNTATSVPLINDTNYNDGKSQTMVVPGLKEPTFIKFANNLDALNTATGKEIDDFSLRFYILDASIGGLFEVKLDSFFQSAILDNHFQRKGDNPYTGLFCRNMLYRYVAGSLNKTKSILELSDLGPKGTVNVYNIPLKKATGMCIYTYTDSQSSTDLHDFDDIIIACADSVLRNTAIIVYSIRGQANQQTPPTIRRVAGNGKKAGSFDGDQSYKAIDSLLNGPMGIDVAANGASIMYADFSFSRILRIGQPGATPGAPGTEPHGQTGANKPTDDTDKPPTVPPTTNDSKYLVFIIVGIIVALMFAGAAVLVYFVVRKKKSK